MFGDLWKVWRLQGWVYWMLKPQILFPKYCSIPWVRCSLDNYMMIEKSYTCELFVFESFYMVRSSYLTILKEGGRKGRGGKWNSPTVCCMAGMEHPHDNPGLCREKSISFLSTQHQASFSPPLCPCSFLQFVIQFSPWFFQVAFSLLFRIVCANTP